MTEGGLKFEPYLVGLADILGQREDFLALKKSLSASQNPRPFTCEESIPVYRVQEVRGFLKEYESLLAEKKLPLRPKLQQFSDTVIFYCPMRSDDANQVFLAVYVTLVTFAKLMLSCLARETAIRGAIEYGFAAKMGKRDLYGPVIADAYDCESKVAQYPRIVIGKDLWGLLLHHRNTDGAQQCRWLIEEDRDGIPFLDFLGKHASKELHLTEFDGGSSTDAVAKGFDFVCREHEKFKADGNKQKRNTSAI